MAALVVDSACTLGESPVWDAATKTLFFCDIMGKRVMAYDPSARTCKSLCLPQMVGTIVPYAGGGLVAALEDRIVGPFHLDTQPATAAAAAGGAVVLPAATSDKVLSDAQLPVLAMWAGAGPGLRFNDGKVTPEGELWTGSCHKAWREPGAPTGSLYALRKAAGSAPPPGELVPLVNEIKLTNGMAWAADGKAFYYTDSASQRVDVFDRVSPGGTGGAPESLANRRPAVSVPAKTDGGLIGGVPDGLTLDAAGRLWVALGESGHVVQYDATTGQQIAAIQLPVGRPTALTWGGEDLSDLYVTTREEPGAAPAPHAGGLFVVRMPGSKGLAAATAMRPL